MISRREIRRLSAREEGLHIGSSVAPTRRPAAARVVVACCCRTLGEAARGAGERQADATGASGAASLGRRPQLLASNASSSRPGSRPPRTDSGRVRWPRDRDGQGGGCRARHGAYLLEPARTSTRRSGSQWPMRRAWTGVLRRRHLWWGQQLLCERRPTAVLGVAARTVAWGIAYLGWRRRLRLRVRPDGEQASAGKGS
jgi:hypothetical protein